MRSSSFNFINGDLPLGLPQKILYRTFNGLSNVFPPKAKPQLDLSPFQLTADELQKSASKLEKKSSPSRILSDLFWMHLPWEQIEKDLNGIRAVDAGCGRGGVFQRVQKFSGNRLLSYIGFDIQPRPEWPTLEKSNVKFVECKARHFLRHVPEGSNFFLSQSALEHFPYDLWYFEQVREWVETYKRPVMQVHLVPSAPCLKLYGSHGWRQYSIRRIQKIQNEYKGLSSKFQIFALGGMHSNRIHNDLIRCSDMRDKNPEKYFFAAMEAIKKDMIEGQVNKPSFYAIVARHLFSLILQIDIVWALCLNSGNV